MDALVKSSPVLFLLVLHVSTVYSQCLGSGSIQQFPRINETEKGVVIQNVTTSPGELWNYTIEGINGNQQTPLAKTVLRAYFRMGYSPGGSRLIFTLEKEINKEFLYTVFRTDVEMVNVRITCSVNSTVVNTIMTIIVDPVNEASPVFQGGPYTVQVPENTAVDSVVFTFTNVTDDDIPKTTTFYYELVDFGNSELDASKYFYIPDPFRNEIKLRSPVDFDHFDRANGSHSYLTSCIVKDAADDTAKTGTTYITFNIMDVDDLPPKFTLPNCDAYCAPVYKAVAAKGPFPSVLDITPKLIEARDQDSFDSPILYSIEPDTAGTYTSFRIDPHTGAVTQISASESGVLAIKATEDSTNRFSSRASLLIQKLSDDNSNNEGNYSAPIVQKSTNKEEGITTTTIAIIIVSVLAIIIITILVVILVIYRTRHWKAVKPSGDQQPTPEPTEGEVIPGETSRTQSKLDLLENQFYATIGTKNNKLPPIITHDMSIGTDDNELKKKRSRKRKKKEPEIFDGTRTYEMEADPEFFSAKDKTKIKRSSRSIKENKQDIKYWITVQDGYLEN